jgi:hypothetical protein
MPKNVEMTPTGNKHAFPPPPPIDNQPPRELDTAVNVKKMAEIIENRINNKQQDASKPPPKKNSIPEAKSTNHDMNVSTMEAAVNESSQNINNTQHTTQPINREENKAINTSEKSSNILKSQENTTPVRNLDSEIDVVLKKAADNAFKDDEKKTHQTIPVRTINNAQKTVQAQTKPNESQTVQAETKSTDTVNTPSPNPTRKLFQTISPGEKQHEEHKKASEYYINNIYKFYNIDSLHSKLKGARQYRNLYEFSEYFDKAIMINPQNEELNESLSHHLERQAVEDGLLSLFDVTQYELSFDKFENLCKYVISELNPESNISSEPNPQEVASKQKTTEPNADEELETAKQMVSEFMNNDKILEIKGGDNGVNQCWLNTALYMILASKKLFSLFVDHLQKSGENKDDITNLINNMQELANGNKWNRDGYDEFINNYEAFAKTIDNDFKIENSATFARDGSFRDAKNAFDHIVTNIHKYIVGEKIEGNEFENYKFFVPLTNNYATQNLDYTIANITQLLLDYKENNDKHYIDPNSLKLYAILKGTNNLPTHTPLGTNANVCHWVAYVNKSFMSDDNNTWVELDMNTDDLNYTREIEYNDIIKKDSFKEKEGNFVYLVFIDIKKLSMFIKLHEIML